MKYQCCRSEEKLIEPMFFKTWQSRRQDCRLFIDICIVYGWRHKSHSVCTCEISFSQCSDWTQIISVKVHYTTNWSQHVPIGYIVLLFPLGLCYHRHPKYNPNQLNQLTHSPKISTKFFFSTIPFLIKLNNQKEGKEERKMILHGIQFILKHL